MLLILMLSDKFLCQNTCQELFQIYVYDIPKQLLTNSEDARQNKSYHICKKCIYEQFSLEYIVYDYFTTHPCRTKNPYAADFFYLPIIRDIDYRIALSKSNKPRDPSIIEMALLDAIENYKFSLWLQVFNVTNEYWLRNNGSDHILVMPAPVTNFRHQSNMRGFFHYVRILLFNIRIYDTIIGEQLILVATYNSNISIIVNFIEYTK